jgi:hypothetical protein
MGKEGASEPLLIKGPARADLCRGPVPSCQWAHASDGGKQRAAAFDDDGFDAASKHSRALAAPPSLSSSSSSAPATYDVPAPVARALRAFAGVLRVLGLSAASASLPRGAWLWELVRPDGVAVDGVYHVRLFWAGAWRRVTVTDALVFPPSFSTTLTVPCWT